MVSGSFTLSEKDFDIFTKCDVKNGFGIFGLTRFYNMGGTVADFRTFGDCAFVTLLDTGRCAAYCDVAPNEVVSGGNSIEFSYDNGLLMFDACAKEIVIKK